MYQDNPSILLRHYGVLYNPEATAAAVNEKAVTLDGNRFMTNVWIQILVQLHIL